MRLSSEINKIKKSIKSVRLKLFLTLCIVITVVILLLVIVNNVVLEKIYLYNKTKVVKQIYEQINSAFDDKLSYTRIEQDLKTLSIKNNLDIIIRTDDGFILLATDKYKADYEEEIELFFDIIENGEKIQSLYKEKQINIELVKENDTKVSYMMVSGNLNNGYELYMKTPTTDMQESARISNKVLLALGSIVIIVSGLVSSFVSRKFTAPILELNDIAQKMSNLDFSQRYEIKDTEDEINNLGKSINTMSSKLENTINKLTANNSELEKDIERKSKIDEMRKQFISDVSHELKTPIALIQGYAEGLVENVNADDESREFYANVILDEANKMDRLVKQLLELMKLEYGKRQFNNESFDIVLLIDEVIKKSNVMLEENKINVKFEQSEPIMVFADIFYMEQIITNYLTNAIKYSKEVNGERRIEVSISLKTETGKVRISVFNTGDNIDEGELQRIWGRFYKIDSSRNREKGGTGIGLAFVKAIMNNYANEYGAINKTDGIEFFFEVDIDKI